MSAHASGVAGSAGCIMTVGTTTLYARLFQYGQSRGLADRRLDLLGTGLVRRPAKVRRRMAVVLAKHHVKCVRTNDVPPKQDSGDHEVEGEKAGHHPVER